MSRAWSAKHSVGTGYVQTTSAEPATTRLVVIEYSIHPESTNRVIDA